MLQIGEPQRDDAEKQQARPKPLHGKELSLDELFSNQSKVKLCLARNSNKSVAVVLPCQNIPSENNFLDVKPFSFLLTKRRHGIYM